MDSDQTENNRTVAHCNAAMIVGREVAERWQRGGREVAEGVKRYEG